MRPAWDELRMNPNRPISWNDRFGTDSMIGTSQSNADRPMELDLRSRRRSVSGLDRPKAITDVNIRPWEKTQLARRLFEQHEGTQKHQTYGWGFGQTALMKYTTNKPIIEYSDLSIS